MKYTYKLVPMEAAPEMEQAAEKYWNERRFKGLSDDPRTWAGVYQAMLTAAPSVQGEPVYLYRRLGLNDFVTCDFARYTELTEKSKLFETKILYTTPQSAEQPPAPDVAELVEERGYAMRFALPEVVAWWDGESNITRKVGRPAAHNWHQRIDLIRLSDYKALQAECEKLRALLLQSAPIIHAHAGASHMLEGFKPKRNKWDALVEQIDAAITKETGRDNQ